MLALALACAVLAADPPAEGGDPSDAPPVPAEGVPVDPSTRDAGVVAPTFPFELIISGNQVLTDDVYRAVLVLPAQAHPDATTADLVEHQLTDFLTRAGYTLGQVHVVPSGNVLYVAIDEGVLEKVVFRGRLTFQMVRLKLALDLPKDVFNAPSLDRQLDQLAQDLHIDRPRWELVRSQTVRHLGPQLTDLSMLGTIGGRPLVRPQEPYELHVFFTDKEWSDGPGLDVRSSYFDGFELGLNEQGSSLLWNKDRWRAAVMGGVGLRNDLAANRLYVFPSRLVGEVMWFTPPLDGAQTFRPYVRILGTANARQRKDLNLENYFSTTNEVSFNLPVQLFESLKLFLGFGLQHFLVFGARAPPGTEPSIVIDDRFRVRSFVEAKLDWTFTAGNGRWDRRHALTLEGRLSSNLTKPQEPTFSELRVAYQKVFPLGWHDLWLKAHGTWLTGDVLFHFEEPLGDSLRGVFGDIFVRAAGGVRGEFRFSLTRDLYKLGFFLDTAAYGEQNRVSGQQTPRFGFAFGPSFHALIEGMFQMDLALSFGWVSTGRFDTGLNAMLIKVF